MNILQLSQITNIIINQHCRITSTAEANLLKKYQFKLAFDYSQMLNKNKAININQLKYYLVSCIEKVENENVLHILHQILDQINIQTN